jgi:hypothetical protein
MWNSFSVFLRRTYPMNSNSENQIPGSLFIVLTALFLLICMATLDRAGYGLDEVLTTADLRRGFVDMVRARALAGHGPVYFSLAWIWQSLLGEGEFATRLLPLYLGLIGLGLFYGLLLRISDRTTALLSTVLLFTNSTLLLVLQETRPYSLTLPLLTAACFLLLAYEHQPSIRKLLLLALVTALAANTHLAAVLPLAGLILYLLLRRQPAWSPALAICGGLLFVLPLLLVLILYRDTTGPVSWLSPPSLFSLFRAPLVLAGIAGLPLGNLKIPVAIILSVLAFRGVRRFGDHGRLLLYLWLAPLLLALLLSLLSGKDYLSIGRYLVVPAMAQCALLAGGLLQLPPPWKLIRRVPALAVTCLFLWSAVRFLSTSPFLDVRQTLPELQGRLKQHEQLLIIAKNPKWFAYYNQDYSRRTQILQYRIIDDLPQLRGSLNILPSTVRLLVVMQDWDLSSHPLPDSFFSGRLIPRERLQINGFNAFYATPLGISR